MARWARPAHSPKTTPYAPRSPYSASKAASDHLAHAWRHTFGLPTIVTNCSNNYGPYQFPEKLIPLMILRGLAGQPMPVYGQGRNVRDWLFVDDHAEALWLALTKGKVGEMYLIGGESERRNIDVVNTIAGLLDEMAPQRAPHARFISFVERSSRPRPPLCDRSLQDQARARLAAAGLVRPGAAPTVRWYLDNKAWWEPIVSNTYRLERLGTASMTSRVLVIGREGQLARELARARWPDGWASTFAGRPELDLRFPDKAAAAVAASAPDLVVNAAAYTNVDQAESEPDVARLVNAAGPGAIAAACAKDRRDAGEHLDRLRVRRDESWPLSRGRSRQPDRRLWPQQGRGRGADPRRVGRAPDPAHLLGVQPVRHEFREDHDAARQRAPCSFASSPTSAAAQPAPRDLAGAVIAACTAVKSAKAGFGTYHVANSGATTWYDMARRDIRDVGRARRAGAGGRSDHDRRISDEGGTAGQFRARLRTDARARSALRFAHGRRRWTNA